MRKSDATNEGQYTYYIHLSPLTQETGPLTSPPLLSWMLVPLSLDPGNKHNPSPRDQAKTRVGRGKTAGQEQYQGKKKGGRGVTKIPITYLVVIVPPTPFYLQPAISPLYTETRPLPAQPCLSYKWVITPCACVRACVRAPPCPACPLGPAVRAPALSSTDSLARSLSVDPVSTFCPTRMFM